MKERDVDMSAKIVNVYKKNLPVLRLIGKRCMCDPHDFITTWDEWLNKGWFDQLEKLGAAPENEDMYLGVTANNGGYWIGLLFPPDTVAPDGFEYVEVPAAQYAVCVFEGKKDKELLNEDGINLVVEEIGKCGLTPVSLWSAWCIERYSRPFSQDGKGKTLIDCLYEIQ